MNRRTIAFGCVLAILVALFVVLLGFGSNGNAKTARAATAVPAYECYAAAGTNDPPDPTYSNKLRSPASTAAVGLGSTFCTRVGKNKANPGGTSIRCFAIADGQDPPAAVQLTTQFQSPFDSEVGPAREFCMPVTKGPPGPPPPPPPPTPVYECYELRIPKDRDNFTLTLNSQFGPNAGVQIGAAVRLCVPSITTSPPGKGTLGDPHLVCYEIAGGSSMNPNIPRSLNTQLAPETVTVGRAQMLCVTAQQTPKPANTGNLSGVFDILVSKNFNLTNRPDKNNGIFHCIARVDHDASNNQLKTAAQCIGDSAGLGDANSELANISVPGEAPDSIPGPPPPPPYSSARPAKGRGYYYPGFDKSITVTCFKNVGGSLGPNTIWVVDINNAKAQLAATGKQQGQLYIFGRQSQVQCDKLTPSGGEYPAPGSSLAIKLYPISNGAFGNAPWRTEGDADYDNDNCTDFQELDKTGTFKCGDDPWNPFDSNTTDMSGSWSFIATLRPADACFGGTWIGQNDVPQLYNCAGQPNGTFVPGAYYHCYADIQQAVKALTIPILCYTDFGPDTITNVVPGDAPGPGTPLAVNPEQCATCAGDGKAGAAPPGKTGSTAADPRLFADIETQHTVLTGSINNTDNTINITGCFLNLDNMGPLGWVYINATLGLHNWQGTLSLWPSQPANCAGSPAGNPDRLSLEGVKQSTKAALRDTDQDGCPDKNELSNDPSRGGLRDPANPWDYFNPANDSINRTSDITAVVQHYGHDASPPGDVLYDKKYDRSGQIPGSNRWNLRPPDGLIRTGDITAAINSYGHDCGTAINKTPTPTGTTRPTVTPKAPPPPTKSATPSFPLPTP